MEATKALMPTSYLDVDQLEKVPKKQLYTHWQHMKP